MKRILTICFILINMSSQLISDDICNIGSDMCNHKNIIDNTLDYKDKLKSIIYISKNIVFIKENNEINFKTILEFLQKIPTYKSIFTDDDIFMTLAKQCDEYIYIAEVKFNEDYQIDFLEKKVLSISDAENYLIIDRVKYQLSIDNRNYYKDAFTKVSKKIEKEHPKTDKNKISTTDNNMCISNLPKNKRVNVRDLNNYDIVLTKLGNGVEVQILKFNITSSNGQKSHLIQYVNNELNIKGTISAKYLDVNCE